VLVFVVHVCSWCWYFCWLLSVLLVLVLLLSVLLMLVLLLLVFVGVTVVSVPSVGVCCWCYCCQVGPLSPQHGASSGCGWREHPPGMKGSCEYIE
jgi:hypothetical protein